MIEFFAEPPTGALLFEANLTPPSDLVHKGLLDEPAITTLRGRRNVVTVGEPQTIRLPDNALSSSALNDEVTAFRKEFDFYRVRLTTGFLAGSGCRFVWMRLTATLSYAHPERADGAPVAFDVFPMEVLEEHKFSRKFSLSQGLKFAVAEVGSEVSSEHEFIRYEPRLDVAGVLTATPTWTFTSPPRPGLSGTRELFMVLKARRGVSVSAKFNVGAEVKTSFGKIPLGHYESPELVEQQYEMVAG